MSTALRVIHVGLGPIGLGIARFVSQTEGLKIVGAADPAPDKAGKDLGTLLGHPKKMRVKVEADLAKLLRKTKADVAVLSTTSSARLIKAQVAAIVAKKINIVTTCEELSFPVPAHKNLFKEIDKLARAKKVSVLGTGVNPGYAMDALPLMLTAPCARVERVAVTRVVDAGKRRLPLQRKVGAGLNLNQFRRAMSENTVRHVGLVESAYMIAHGLGWSLERVEETLEPVIAPRDLDTEFLRIPAGAAAGIKQFVRGYRAGELVVSLDLQMYVGADNPRDHILVDGDPRVDMTVTGGFQGDIATAAITVNAIPKLMAARPGLVTMAEIPLVHRFNPSEIRSLPKKR
jgi:2,4-diaminopentanoate dehydrogenase